MADMLRRTLTLTILLLPALLAAAEVAHESQYRGWKSIALDNGLIQLQIVPQIGGRVMQFKLGDFEFLWVNDDLAGKAPPASGLGPNGEWLNYGGDKLWPAPQDQWKGPPDAVLDGGPYTAEIVPTDAGSGAVKLTSPPDARSGIQFSRTIKIEPNST